MAATNKKVSNYIPDDISYSILSKLPLKSLKRFQCVQKSWSLLFQDHHFMNIFCSNFLSYHEPSSTIILRTIEKYHERVFYSFSGERFENKVKLDWSSSIQNHFQIVGCGSVNGTLCLCGVNDDIVLWNPASQIIKHLPDNEEAQLIESSLPDEALGLGGVICVVNYYVHGFGYDPAVINDYKVIRFVNVHLESYDNVIEDVIAVDLSSYTGFDPFWEIYSLRSNSWKKLHVDMPYSLVYNDDTQVYTDGVCHWLGEENCSKVGPCLVSFYLSNEKFFLTPIPCFDVKPWWTNLAVLNRSIALISYLKETTTFHISILGEFGTKESWSKLSIVGPLSCVEHPIVAGIKGEIFFIRKDKELVWLDLSTQMIAELGYKVVEVHCSQIIIYK